MDHDRFDYAFHRTRDWTHYEVYLRRFRGDPSPILEMGCGIGLFLEACRQNGIEAEGVEYEQEGVQAAIGKGLRARQHDLSMPVPFADASFAAVFSNQVIEHLPAEAQRMMVAEAYRVLRPGGQVLIISPCVHYPPARADKYHIGLLAPSQLKRMCEDAGFVDCNMGYNRMQSIDPVPDEVLRPIWQQYHPDQLSQDATVLAWKPPHQDQ